MDTIAATAFGLKINSQRNAEDQFVKNAKHFFSNTVTSAKLFFLCKYIGNSDVAH